LRFIVIIRPHRSTYVGDAAYCYRPSSVVCRSVTLVSPAKTAEPIDMSFGLWTRMGPKESCVRWGPDPPWEGAMFGERAPIVKYTEFLLSAVQKTVEPIDLPFGLWTRLGQRKHKFNALVRWRRNVAITTEPSVCCGDAALCQITLTTCCYYHRKSSTGRRVTNTDTEYMPGRDLFAGRVSTVPNKRFTVRPNISIDMTRMWANAQCDGRPAEHRWRPLFNTAKFG